MPGDRQRLRHQLYQLAASQAGYFTAAQAVEIGYTHQAQKYHVDHGNWRRVDRGIFRLPEWPTGVHDSLVRWYLWSKQRAVVSHDSAAVAHGLGLVNPAKVHLTVPPDFRMQDDYVALHHRHLPDGDITRLDGAPITTVPRTTLDLIEAHVDEELLEGVVAEAIERGATTAALLRRRYDDLSPEARERADRILERVAE